MELEHRQLSLIPGFQIGDRIKDKDGFIGVIKSVSDRCITAANENQIKSYNLALFKNIRSFIQCLPTSTSLGESEPLALQPETLEKSQQSHTVTSAQTRKKSTKRTSLKSRSTQISEAIIPPKELTSLQEVSPALEPRSLVSATDLTTPNLQCGLNISDASKKDSPGLSLSKTQQDYSIAEWELSYKAYPKAGTMRSGRLSPLQCLEVPKKGSDFLLLPTMTTGLGSRRNAGATRSEKWLKDKLLLQSTQALNPQMMALLFAFPMDWTECLWESPKVAEEEMTSEPCLEEQSILTVPSQLSNESSTSITALTKVRINKTSIDVAGDIAPIFQIQHTVGINIVNPSLLDLVNSLSSDRLRCALDLSEKYGGCQKKRELIAKQIKERTSWDKYLNNSQVFPVGCEVEIMDSKRGTGVWVGHKGIVQPYKQTQPDAASISYRIVVKIFSESAQEFAKPSFEDSELISVNNIDASSSARLQFLLEQRDRLIASGASPPGVWLSVGQVYKKDFRQVVWKSAYGHPWLSNKKSRYIGKENSDEHVSAIAKHRAGQELRKVEREIKSLQNKKNETCNFNNDHYSANAISRDRLLPRS